MDSQRLLLIIFLLVFLFFSPDSRAPSPSQQRELSHSVLKERASLDILNASFYGGLDTASHRWLNLTGFRLEDGYAWDSLPRIQERARQQHDNIFNHHESSYDLDGNTTEPDKSSNAGPAERNNTSQGFSTVETVSATARPSMYRNVTGILNGKWARSAVEEVVVNPPLNLSIVAPNVYYTSEKYNRNITGSAGDLRVQLYEEDNNVLPDPEMAGNIKAQITIKDETSSGDGWELTLFGVHYRQQGGIVLSTTSEKFAGIFALPHFTLSQRAFVLGQRLLNHTLLTTIKEQEADLTSVSNPWTSSPNSASESIFPVPHCEIIMYLQQHPVEDVSISLDILEHELRCPTGASMPSAPHMRMSALIFSPDCGFVLESQGPPDFAPQQGLHLHGQIQESYLRTAKRCILAFAAVVCGQIFLLMRQMKDTSTPSTRSRVSFYTAAIMALGDGIACLVAMVVGMFVDAVFLPLIATAFLSFICVCFFGMKFLMDIWTVQGPEREEQERVRQRERDRRNATRNTAPAPTTALPSTGITVQSASDPSTASAPVIATAGADTLPLPVTARRPTDIRASPIIIPPDQDIDAAQAEDNAMAQTTTQTTLGSARREMSALYTKFYFLLLGIVFLSLHATTWPTTLRSIYSNIVIFIYLSLWLPQIRRNVIRNCRKALRWEFVLGESLLRLAPVVYFYTVPNNILFIDNDRNAAYAMIAWVWIQIWALVSQEILGPRFFVPNGWAPPAYDYHPILHEDDEEAGATMPIGFTQATAADPSSPSASKPRESKEKGKKVFDCAICTENIEVPVIPRSNRGDLESSASATASTIFSRRIYMVTPCRHIFHTHCLEGWMRYRLQCPICRENLPPL